MCVSLVYCRLYMHLCTHTHTHTHIFLSKHGVLWTSALITKEAMLHSFLCTASATQGDLMLLSSLAVIVPSIRVLCDLFNVSKCVHIGRGIERPRGSVCKDDCEEFAIEVLTCFLLLSVSECKFISSGLLSSRLYPMNGK